MSTFPHLQQTLKAYTSTTVEGGTDVGSLLATGANFVVAMVVTVAGQATLAFDDTTDHLVSFIDYGAALGNVNNAYFPFGVPMQDGNGNRLILTTTTGTTVTLLYV